MNNHFLGKTIGATLNSKKAIEMNRSMSVCAALLTHCNLKRLKLDDDNNQSIEIGSGHAASALQRSLRLEK